MKPLAVVLVSGGMDSAVTAALVREEGYDLAFLHVNYAQRTQKKELEAFLHLARHYDVQQQLVVDVGYFADIGGSSLTDKAFDVTKANLSTQEIPTSYVPFRNANILSIATSWAERIGAGAIAIGAVEEDSSGYPDCRKEFYEAFQHVIDLGTKPSTRVALLTPVIEMKKHEIVREGARLGVPFEYTWSCYSSSKRACGECDSCALRLRGFAQAGVTDPLEYVVRPMYG